MGLLLRGVKDVLGAARGATPVLTREAALDRLHQLVAQRDADAAVAFASELAATGLRDDQDVDALLAEVATQYQILSEPPGARVRVKAYEAPHSPWRDIGVTPVDALIANGLRRLRLELEGYDPVEIAEAIPGFVGVSPEFGATYPKVIRLQRPDPARPSMVFVPGISGLQYGPRMSDYFIDRFEVTNEDFKTFVDADGYHNEAYWSHLSFVDGDASLTFGDALKRFVDTTGRSGPAYWRFGDFPEGQSRLPVTGISWFEASAYARFRGGELPTAGHWDLAAIEGLDMVAPFAPAVIAQSNFSAALAPVGASTAISAVGAYDMAGNAREWVRNAIGNRRTTLGGSHRDPEYMFVHKVALDPWQRDDVTGFRTIRSLDDDDPSVDLPLRTYEPPRDLTPVSDDEFKILATQFTYTRSEPRVVRRELVGPRARWRYERIDLRYRSGASLTLHLTLPGRGVKFQPVLLFPGQEQFNGPKATVPFDAYYKVFDLSMLVDGGRAVVEVVWHGSNERYANVDQMGPEEQGGYYRDAVTIWRREMGLVLDYLSSRDDIDTQRAIFLGVSYGATFPLPSAVMEERFQAFVLLYGGLTQFQDTRAPVAASKNFLPRLQKPVFMLNGRLDSTFTPECSQALFDLLGTPAADKRLDMLDAGHGYWTNREMLMIVDWLDERLGRSGIH